MFFQEEIVYDRNYGIGTMDILPAVLPARQELILGKQDDFVWVDFPEGDTKTELEAHIAEALQTMKKQSIFWCSVIC